MSAMRGDPDSLTTSKGQSEQGCGVFSFRSAVADVRGRKGIIGTLLWEKPEDLLDLDGMAASIRWGESACGLESPKDLEGFCRTIQYRLSSGIFREYVVGSCQFCNRQLCIDLEEPGYHPSEEWSLPYGTGLVPTPKFLRSPVSCTLALDGAWLTHWDYPACQPSYNSKLEEWEKETGLRWTIWSMDQVVLYEPSSDRYGILIYEDGRIFWDKEKISGAIVWGALPELAEFVNKRRPSNKVGWILGQAAETEEESSN